jgi:hypothetical protein
MQLFKSQWLQEQQGRAPRDLTYREAVFGRRYGARAATVRRTFCQSELVPGGDFAVATHEAPCGPAPRPEFDRAA